MDEDCLALNVWTPARDADEALPVMVWFYGGSFVFGSASDIRFDGEAFARKGGLLITAMDTSNFAIHFGLTPGVSVQPAQPTTRPTGTPASAAGGWSKTA